MRPVTTTELPSTLQHLLRSNADSNPALDASYDYAEYHAVLAVLGALVTRGAPVLLTVYAWRPDRACSPWRAAGWVC